MCFFSKLISFQVLPLLNDLGWKQLIFSVYIRCFVKLRALCNQSVDFVVLEKVLLGLYMHV
jgi:hypothetical protein